jgi:hypothetical protein
MMFFILTKRKDTVSSIHRRPKYQKLPICRYFIVGVGLCLALDSCGGSSLPQNWPANVPLYPNLSIVQTRYSDQEVDVFFKTHDTATQVFQFYHQAITSQNGVVDDNSDVVYGELCNPPTHIAVGITGSEYYIYVNLNFDPNKHCQSS